MISNPNFMNRIYLTIALLQIYNQKGLLMIHDIIKRPQLLQIIRLLHHYVWHLSNFLLLSTIFSPSNTGEIEVGKASSLQSAQ